MEKVVSELPRDEVMAPSLSRRVWGILLDTGFNFKVWSQDLGSLWLFSNPDPKHLSSCKERKRMLFKAGPRAWRHLSPHLTLNRSIRE